MAARAERRVEAARLEALRAGITTSLAELREFIGDIRDERTQLRDVLVPAEGDSEPSNLDDTVGMALLGGTSAFHPQLWSTTTCAAPASCRCSMRERIEPLP